MFRFDCLVYIVVIVFTEAIVQNLRAGSVLEKRKPRASTSTSRQFGYIDIKNGAKIYSTSKFTTKYLNNEDCYWIVQAKSGNSIKINFQDFDTEMCCDHITIYKKGVPFETGNEIWRKSGHLNNGENIVTFPYSTIYLRLKSDGSVAGRGFTAVFEEVYPVVPTTKTTTTTSTTTTTTTTTTRPKTSFNEGLLMEELILSNKARSIASPGFPQPYKNNEKVYWLIRSITKGIRLSFSVFDTESCCDSLTIYKGDTLDHDNEIWTKSGTGTGTVVDLNETIISILFESDGSVTGNGFKASIERSPLSTPKTITVVPTIIPAVQTAIPEISTARPEIRNAVPTNIPSTIPQIPTILPTLAPEQNIVPRLVNTISLKGKKECISSPGYPMTYENRENDFWIVRAQNVTNGIRVSFTDFNARASNDFVAIYRGESTLNGNLIWRKSGNLTNLAEAMVNLDEPIVVIHFESDNSGTSKGFRAVLEESKKL